MGCVALLLFLILLSGDVETNPGPLAPLARGPNLEKVGRIDRLRVTPLEDWTSGRINCLNNGQTNQQDRLMKKQLDDWKVLTLQK